MEVSLNGHAELVNTLLQHGASVDLKKEVNLLAIIIMHLLFLFCLILQYIVYCGQPSLPKSTSAII